MREIIKHIQEAGIFKGASKEDIAKRKADNLARIKKERGGKMMDVCPHCGVDLRKEGGVVLDETRTGTRHARYDEYSKQWMLEDEEDWNVNNVTWDGYRCEECGGELEMGKNFDENEDLVGQ
jgi:uncharacterized protein with PIN domain